MRGVGDAVVFERELESDAVRRMADAVKETCGGMALVFSGDDEHGYKYAIAVKDGDIRAYVKDLNTALNGRGGGRDSNFVQGSVKACKAEIENYIQKKSV